MGAVLKALYTFGILSNTIVLTQVVCPQQKRGLAARYASKNVIVNFSKMFLDDVTALGLFHSTYDVCRYLPDVGKTFTYT